MNVKVKFLGGTRTVTGSKYLLEIDHFKILIDCGIFQGEKEIRDRNWTKFPVNIEEIDAVILTHAHLDHSGYLPKIVKEGYNGSIYCTKATAALCEILLKDSAKLMMEEATFINNKLVSNFLSTTNPLYTIDDAEKVFSKWECYDYYESFLVTKNIEVQFYNAGHILGSSIIEITIHGESQSKKIVFSGDLGRPNSPILYPADIISTADVVFIESTYGGREMPEDIWEEFSNVVNESFSKGGMLLVPSFAVGRTQQLIYLLKKLRDENKIPQIPIYVDSPMAINVTFLYSDFFDYHKLEEKEFLDVFRYKDIHYYQEKELSKSLNSLDKACIVISASGMCNGGRIMHHLFHRLPKKNDTLLFVGFQAKETRGREILEKNSTTNIFGINVPIHCNVKKINGLSAHADRSELIDWLSGFDKSPKWTFIVHGEEKSNIDLQNEISKKLGWKSIIPEYLESFELFNGI